MERQAFRLRVCSYSDVYISIHNTLRVMCVTTEPSDERNFSPGFIQLRTPARINICSATQQPPETKLDTI